MTDRIDAMTHDELKAATRYLVYAVESPGANQHDRIRLAMENFHPTTLDKVRELLKAEGWHNSVLEYDGSGHVEISRLGPLQNQILHERFYPPK